MLTSGGDVVHVDKCGRFDVDVVLKSLFMRAGKVSDDICNRFDPEITMKVTTSNVPRCADNTV
jgi:hypothetical protein